MKLEEMSGKSLLMLGKSRALAPEEFRAQLSHHDITINHEFDNSVVYIVEGRLMNPIEQELHDTLYAQNAAPIVSVDEIERLLCETIDSERLMMSLKLSNDQERLIGFIQNRLIDDGLFLRLLKLYDWKNEGFFENDENRDVTAALIERFYANIERNHNVQYANMGIMHLIAQTESPELIETIATLSPMQNALKKGSDNSTVKILHAIATHPATSKSVLKQFVKYADIDLAVLIASRSDIDATLEQKLYDKGSEAVHAALAANASLQSALFERFIADECYRDTVARCIVLDDARFAALLPSCTVSLASNPSLTPTMQQTLLTRGSDAVNVALASNPNLEPAVAEALYAMGLPAVGVALAANHCVSERVLEKLYEESATHAALASNPQAPARLLGELGNSSDIIVLTALAKNPSTPVDVLYQLQLDKRLERYVMANEGFGRHIQTENIGWQL